MSLIRKTNLANSVFKLTLPKNSCSVMLSSCSLLLKHMEYIHETSRMAKSYRDDVSQTRKTTLAKSVFKLTPLAKKIHVV